MALDINLPSELQRHYRDEVGKRGMSVEASTIRVIEQGLAENELQRAKIKQALSEEHGDS